MSHRLITSAAAAALTLPLVAGPATAQPRPAQPDGSLRGLTLVGTCPGQASVLKNVTTTPRTPWLFGPMGLWDNSTSKFTGKWLFPYTVQVWGEGLKSRHLGPGEVYTRPGRTPSSMITCEFEGKTPEGPFQVSVTGPIRGW